MIGQIGTTAARNRSPSLSSPRVRLLLSDPALCIVPIDRASRDNFSGLFHECPNERKLIATGRQPRN